MDRQTINKFIIRKSADQKCTATLLGKTGGKISTSDLKQVNSITVSGPCDYTISSYKLFIVIHGMLHEWQYPEEGWDTRKFNIARTVPWFTFFHTENHR